MEIIHKLIALRYVMKRYLCLIFFLAFASATTLSGQCSSKATKLYKRAKLKQDHQVEEAILDLIKAKKACPSSEKIIFLLADLQNQKRNYREVTELLTAYLSKKKLPKANYFLAQAHHRLFEFDQAIENYQAYLDSEATNRTLMLRSAVNLAHAKFAKQSYTNPPVIDFTPFPSKINTEASEYLPIMTADESKMVFTRREAVAEEAYFVEKQDGDQWSVPRTLVGLPAQFRKAAVSMSIDGQMLVFAMADHPQGIGNFDLYFMEFKNGEWSRAQNFGANVNTPGWESQPCISADGRTVFFSTDRRGGEGGHDIWKTKRNSDGTWSKPTNLGIEVNGPKNEESPFIHRDQRTLYFRSESHPGLGSFDIFMSRKIRFKKWTIPLNLGYPVNTIGNDGSLFVSLDGRTAYIASDVDHMNLSDYKNQPLMSHIDIFDFQLEEKFRPIPTTYVNLTFEDAQSHEAVSPHVELIDNRSGDTLFIGDVDNSGELLICLPMNSEYALSAISEDHLPHFERFEPLHESWSPEPLIKTVILNKVIVPTPEVVAKPVVLKNVLFETNEATLTSSSFLELNKLANFLRANASVNIIIRGHTDNIGDPADNLSLSNRRAQSVYNYLIDQGINETRLSFEGFGETVPVADNSTENGRRKNRRTEFVVR